MAEVTAPRKLFISTESLSPEIAMTCAQCAKEAGFDPILSENKDAVVQQLEKRDWSIVIRAIRSADEMNAQVGFVRQLKQQRGSGVILIALNHVRHSQAHRILSRIGFSEIISVWQYGPAALKPRLKYILDKTARMMNDPEAQLANGLLPGADRLIKSQKVKLLKPLELLENCWLMRRMEDAKLIHGHWVVNLVGPGPLFGRWLRQTNAPINHHDAHSVWEWNVIPGAPRSLHSGTFGRWVFWGRRPLFHDYHWTFIGKEPRLAYFEAKDHVADFFSLNHEGALAISGNSMSALEKWDDIYTSLIGKMHFEKKAEIIEQLRYQFTSKPKTGEDEETTWRDVVGVTETEETVHFQSQVKIYQDLQKRVAPKPKVFNLIEDDAGRESYFKEIRDRKGEALVWTVGQLCKFQTPVVDVTTSPTVLHLRIPTDIDPANVSGKVFVNVSCPRGGVFFSTTSAFLRWELGELLIPIPSELFEVQRRSHFRLSIPDNYGMFLRLSDWFFRIDNISESGLALSTKVLKENSDSILKKGMIFENVSFDVNGREIRCEMEVRWVRFGDDLNAGMRFVNLSANDRQWIHLFVMESSYDYLMRYVI